MHRTFLYCRRDRVGRAGEPDTTLLAGSRKGSSLHTGHIHGPRARLVSSFRRKMQRAKPPGGALMGSLRVRTADEFPRRRISPHRLRGGLREEIQVEAPRSRSGRPPQLAQNVCSRSVVASISDCGWGTAPPRRRNQRRPPVSSTVDAFLIYYLQTRERDILRIAFTPQVRGDRGPECRLTAMPFGFAAWFLPLDERNVRGTRQRC
jgi:hypothetical protein